MPTKRKPGVRVTTSNIDVLAEANADRFYGHLADHCEVTVYSPFLKATSNCQFPWWSRGHRTFFGNGCASYYFEKLPTSASRRVRMYVTNRDDGCAAPYRYEAHTGPAHALIRSHPSYPRVWVGIEWYE